MAIFKCHNCGVKKIIDVRKEMLHREKKEITCDECKSKWIKYYAPGLILNPDNINELIG